MKRFRLSTLAEADLDEIWLYVARDRTVDVANRLIDDIMDGIILLASHPKAGRLRDELAAGLRSFPVRNHVIYYRPVGSVQPDVNQRPEFHAREIRPGPSSAQ